ncbi:MAG: antitoxin [Verrucomicrobia bacterium]|nr:antitoxin [Verrucomicrobiota bacterium]MCH8526214.1 antitoxin [Kiritimatiellia bacterium]
MRTTLDLDPTVLRQLKALKKREKKTIGHLANALLAEALSRHEAAPRPETAPALVLHSQSMRAKIDLADKDSLWEILDKT